VTPGAGLQTLDMQFLEDVVMTCEVCEGKRFKPDVLKIQYHGKDISEILNIALEKYVAPEIVKIRWKDLYPTKEESKRSVYPTLRGSLLGFFVGLGNVHRV
jgi:predicted nucleic-acid-binding Zn-ribbon protein